MTDPHTDDHSSNNQSRPAAPPGQSAKKSRGNKSWLSWLLVLIIFGTAVWYVQTQGPFVVNGVSLGVPVSE